MHAGAFQERSADANKQISITCTERGISCDSFWKFNQARTALRKRNGLLAVMMKDFLHTA
jgi:hypothetical protein